MARDDISYLTLTIHETRVLHEALKSFIHWEENSRADGHVDKSFTDLLHKVKTYLTDEGEL